VSIRHLDFLFDPRSVAVFGASDRHARVGTTVWRNLRSGGFSGALWAVNPRLNQLDGQPVYADVAALPAAPDLAVIATPPHTVPDLIEALGQRGTRAAVVLTAGLDSGARQAMLDAARRHLLRIVGPNCLGMIVPPAGLNASFAHLGAHAGPLAFISQSGALATAMLDWAQARGIGFSRIVSLGEHADVDFGDLLDWLATDAATRAILLYVESIESTRKFMSAARAAARNKPVIAVKSGRSPQGQAAAASHTGALAGSDLVYDAAIRRSGMLRVETLQELFIAAEALAGGRAQPRPQAAPHLEQLTLVTNGGGAGVMAADAAAAHGLALAPLTSALRQALDAFLPANWSRANPVDIIGDAPVERYVQTLQALLADPASGTILFMHAPTAIVPSAEIARALVPVIREARGRVVSCWLGDTGVAEARRIFQAAGITHYETPEEAVRAFAMEVDYRRNQEQLMEAPSASAGQPQVAVAEVAALADAALAEGREWLTEPEAKAVLQACGIPVVPTRSVPATAEAASRAAQALGFPVALKILSPDITHKSDVGGVALDLENATAVRSAARAMLKRVTRHQPDARLAGFTVQPMVRRPRALELIVGASVDPLFGPTLLFGQGGTAVELLADRALALPPLNEPLARQLIARTRISRLMAGWRDVPPVNQAAVVGVLTALSELLAREPRIAELDINPLLADADGVVALDARVRVSAQAPGGADHFAIRPYPAEWTETFDWQDRPVTLRAIRPEDEAQHLAFLESLDPEDVRLRVFYSRRTIERSELARLTQIDYEREICFVATAPMAGGGEETLGVVRALCDPDNIQAEFGIVVRSQLKGGGLGRRLMDKLLTTLRGKGTVWLIANVLKENHRMLAMARQLGFTVTNEPHEPGVQVLRLCLSPPLGEGPATTGDTGHDAGLATPAGQARAGPLS
jgi:acetyltransferase